MEKRVKDAKAKISKIAPAPKEAAASSTNLVMSTRQTRQAVAAQAKFEMMQAEKANVLKKLEENRK